HSHISTSTLPNVIQHTHIHTLSLHDALPICPPRSRDDDNQQHAEKHEQQSAAHPERDFERDDQAADRDAGKSGAKEQKRQRPTRSEEHTSELQSPDHLVCRLLLEKKKHVKMI